MLFAIIGPEIDSKPIRFIIDFALAAARLPFFYISIRAGDASHIRDDALAIRVNSFYLRNYAIFKYRTVSQMLREPTI